MASSDPAPPPAAAAYYLPRHLAPSPTYPPLYPPYLLRGYPDTAALENRQTIINDYITSQQMHHNAATAMAQRADMLRGLSPRESSLALNYAAGPRGGWPPSPSRWAAGGATQAGRAHASSRRRCGRGAVGPGGVRRGHPACTPARVPAGCVLLAHAASGFTKQQK